MLYGFQILRAFAQYICQDMVCMSVVVSLFYPKVAKIPLGLPEPVLSNITDIEE